MEAVEDIDISIAFSDCEDRADYLNVFRSLYAEYGISALSQTWLKDRNGMEAYKRANHMSLNMQTVADDLNITESYYKEKVPWIWTPEKMNMAAKTLIEERGCIPSYTWLNKNGYGGLLNRLSSTGTTLKKFRLKHQSDTR